MLDEKGKISMDVQSNAFSNDQLKINDLPQWQDIEHEPLAKAAPWEPFWQSCIFVVVLLLFASATFFIPTVPLFVTIGAYSVILLSFSFSQWHNFEGHKVRGVALREKDISVRKGLFWQQRTLLPFNRVQHIEIHRNPIERKLGLSSLRIFTAGGSGVDLQISGLENERAEKIKLFILEKTKSETVDK